jgi:alkylation response protein AidB-like acyl-CoA dehydrogenase
MVLDAPSADRLIASATTGDEEGTALFLVDPKGPGINVTPYPLVDGTRAADILFDHALIPQEALLASGNRGAALLGEARDRASVTLMAQAVGSMEACLTLCGDYVKERKQFGQPIGSFQAIQHMLADMFVAANQARSILYHAIAASRDGPDARQAAVSAARIVIGEGGQVVSRNGIQLHGGYGITDEYPISHHYRRLMCLEKIGGDIGRHVRRLGDHVFAS